jgi:hypothetical protein
LSVSAGVTPFVCLRHDEREREAENAARKRVTGEPKPAPATSVF